MDRDDTHPQNEIPRAHRRLAVVFYTAFNATFLFLLTGRREHVEVGAAAGMLFLGLQAALANRLASSQAAWERKVLGRFAKSADEWATLDYLGGFIAALMAIAFVAAVLEWAFLGAPFCVATCPR